MTTQPPDSTSRPERGLLIAGRYQLVSELGRGGMGAVWVAHDRVESRTVAVKFQRVIEAASERRFVREADALCRLSCPHVVRFFYAGRERGLSFIVMEHLLGHTLRRRMELSGALHPGDVSALLWQAAIGLGSAHRAGIVHRDVKPSNLFITDHGKDCLKVIDFGIAKGRGLDASTAGSGAVGSPGFMSPEQALGERVDHRSDVWSLAVVAFAALSGKEPFTAENVPATLERIWRGQAQKLTQLRPDLPPALDAFFARAFVQDPSHRFQSTSELAVHFERAVQGVALEPHGRLSKTKSLAPSVPGARLAALSRAPSERASTAPQSLPAPPSTPPAAARLPMPASYPASPASNRPAPASYPPGPTSAPPASANHQSSERPLARSAGAGIKLVWVLIAAGAATAVVLLVLWVSQR